MTAPRNVVLRGDCLEVMRGLPADSVDAVVTDPPYELGFMGKSWDSAGVSYDPTTWAEALRVLKPGGHLLAFGGSRTYHRIAVAIEDAGFEIRDSLMWIYGSGFPKSLDVSKSMDKRRNDKTATMAVTAWLNAAVKRSGTTYAQILAHFGLNPGSGMVGHWTALSLGAQPSCPTWDQWLELQRLLGFGTEMDAEVWRLNGRKGTPGEAWAEREVIGQHTPGMGSGKSFGMLQAEASVPEDRKKIVDITAPATEEAKHWEGWGTALKPSHEPIVLARKPLIGTVAENVLAHGTGALNIDASRLEGDRWPANTLWDEEAAAQLDASTPAQPSRFFYVAKPGTKERSAGVDGSNTHPTVKPIALMRYLIKLVTPPGGVVLDPFLGSGSTACAAVLEGFDYIGIEQNPDYAKIAEARIAHWKKEAE